MGNKATIKKMRFVNKLGQHIARELAKVVDTGLTGSDYNSNSFSQHQAGGESAGLGSSGTGAPYSGQASFRNAIITLDNIEGLLKASAAKSSYKKNNLYLEDLKSDLTAQQRKNLHVSWLNSGVIKALGNTVRQCDMTIKIAKALNKELSKVKLKRTPNDFAKFSKLQPRALNEHTIEMTNNLIGRLNSLLGAPSGLWHEGSTGGWISPDNTNIVSFKATPSVLAIYETGSGKNQFGDGSYQTTIHVPLALRSKFFQSTGADRAFSMSSARDFIDRSRLTAGPYKLTGKYNDPNLLGDSINPKLSTGSYLKLAAGPPLICSIHNMQSIMRECRIALELGESFDLNDIYNDGIDGGPSPRLMFTQLSKVYIEKLTVVRNAADSMMNDAGFGDGIV